MEVVHSGLQTLVCVNLPLFHIVYTPTDLLINHGMASEACYSLFLEELQKECNQSQQLIIIIYKQRKPLYEYIRLRFTILLY